MAGNLVKVYPLPGFVLGFGLTPVELEVSPEEADRLVAEYPGGYTKTPPKPAAPDKPTPVVVAPDKEA